MQFIGLQKKAQDWLKVNAEIIPKLCPHCKGELPDFNPNFIVVESKFVDCFSGDGVTLNTYLLKNGEKIKEIIQASPWSSGPMIFLCLEKENGKRMFKWSQKQINDYD